MNKPMTTLRQPRELVARGLVSPNMLPELEKVASRYAVALTPHVMSLIDPSDPNDPIALQYVPTAKELESEPGERADPIGDAARSPVEGIVHRYPDRVLFKLVHVCAVYCRFCFRREMVGPGKDSALSAEVYANALDYIRTHSEIWEVILTGGDPLVLSPRRLKAVAAELAAIDHVKIMRVHTRMPVATPERVTPALVRALKASAKALYVVLHVNHARELSPAVRAACARLVDAGIPMLSQSVLLRGVNDDPASLGELMRTLVECRIKPYYLHHGDLAPGTSHWRTTIEEGRALMRALHGRYSGLCQPSYVLDIPGGHGKVPVGPRYVEEGHVTDPAGSAHRYP
jgi:lysine 2,3-aminomutase